MSFLSSSLNVLHVAWRIVRIPFLLGLGLAIGFLVPYAWHLDREVRSRFDDLSWELPSRVYARPLQLAPGLPMNPDMLLAELGAARYGEDAQAATPGTFHRDGARWTIVRRAFVYLDGREREKRITLGLARLLRARSLHLIVTGARKRDVLRAAQTAHDPLRAPISALLHASGTVVHLHWSP